MQLNINTINGHESAVISFISGLGAAFSSDNIDPIMRIILGIVSLATGIMACRYYYFSIKEKKEAIKRYKGETKRFSDEEIL